MAAPYSRAPWLGGTGQVRPASRRGRCRSYSLQLGWLPAHRRANPRSKILTWLRSRCVAIGDPKHHGHAQKDGDDGRYHCIVTNTTLHTYGFAFIGAAPEWKGRSRVSTTAPVFRWPTTRGLGSGSARCYVNGVTLPQFRTPDLYVGGTWGAKAVAARSG
jgi:hypothetical protein